MDNSLLEYIRNNGTYTTYDLTLLESEVVPMEYKKDEEILPSGEVCSAIHFITKGAVVHFRLDEDYKEIIIDLNGPNDWVLNHKSFANRSPSAYTIKAYENTATIKLSIEAIHRLIGKSQAFLQLGKILEESTSRVEFFDKNYTPANKYEYLVKHRGDLIQTFPQHMIASYLKITPETLSRVRSRNSCT